jgi:polysaccharide chain length determinant protein (PEP-CTERM system associated)
MLDRILGVWRRRKWVAIAVFAAPVAVLIGLVTSLPNIYRAAATVLVERQQVPESFVRPTVTGEIETRLQTISQEIFSRSSLEGLITRFNLYPRQRERLSPEALVARMRNDIILTVKSDSGTAGGPKMVAFTVSYRGGDPSTVADVTNTLAALFIEENLRVRARQATGIAEFLRHQLEETTQELDLQEARVSEYNRRNMGELPQQMSANLAAIEQLSTQLRLNNDRQTLALARREALERQLADAETGPLAHAAPGAPDTPSLRLTRLQQELRELRTQYTEIYPEVVRVKTEIAVLERELAVKKPDGAATAVSVAAQDPAARRLRGALTELEAETKALKKDEQRLQAAIARYQKRVDNSPQREQEFQELSRNYQTTKDHYQSLLKRYQEAQLAEDMEQRRKGEQFKIVDRAIVSDRPAAPNRARFLLTGLILALGLAAAAVVVAEQLDTSFHTVDELRTFTRVPVFVSIPSMMTRHDSALRRRRFQIAVALGLLALGALSGGSHQAGKGNAALVSLLSPGGS